jgi:hypothetical protein
MQEKSQKNEKKHGSIVREHSCQFVADRGLG